MTRPVTDAMVDRAFRTWCSCQAKDMSIEATLRACLASAVAPILSEVLLESPKFTARLNDRFFGLSDDTRQWLIAQAVVTHLAPSVAPVAVSVKGLDTFNGDNAALIRSAEALLALDARNALAPHGIGGHARGLLETFIARRSSIIPATKGGDTSELRRAANALINNLWIGAVSGNRSHEENWREFDRRFPGVKWLHDELAALTQDTDGVAKC